MPREVEGTTMERFLEGLAREGREGREERRSDPEMEELVRRHGLVEGAIIWISRHRDEVKKLVEQDLEKSGVDEEIRSRASRMVDFLVALGKELEKRKRSR